MALFLILKLESEVMIMITAELDQTIRIEVYNMNVLHCSNDSICPMCHAFNLMGQSFMRLVLVQRWFQVSI